MHAALRTLPLVALGLCSFSSLRSQTTELPAIFAPKMSAERARTPMRAPPSVGTSPVSERVRSLISAAAARVLVNAVVFNAPTNTTDVVVDESSGAMVMAPVVVRGQSLQDSQVRPPAPRRFHFNTLGGDEHRGVAGGVTMPLYHTFIGQKELQVDSNCMRCGPARGRKIQLGFKPSRGPERAMAVLRVLQGWLRRAGRVPARPCVIMSTIPRRRCSK